VKKQWLSVVLVGFFLIALTGSALAWSGKADVDGKPVQFSPGGPKGYYIWQDDHGFHIWTTTRGEEHVFSGVIRTDGRIYHVRGHRLETPLTYTAISKKGFGSGSLKATETPTLHWADVR